MSNRFIILDHPADIGIEAYGKTKRELFLNSATGLMSIIAGDSKIDRKETFDISIHAIDEESLLVKWLSEILYFYDAKKFLTCDADFKFLNETSLIAKLYGENFTSEKHELNIDVKAVTYHQLEIKKEKDLWSCRVFFDI